MILGTLYHMSYGYRVFLTSDQGPVNQLAPQYTPLHLFSVCGLLLSGHTSAGLLDPLEQ